MCQCANSACVYPARTHAHTHTRRYTEASIDAILAGEIELYDPFEPYANEQQDHDHNIAHGFSTHGTRHKTSDNSSGESDGVVGPDASDNSQDAHAFRKMQASGFVDFDAHGDAAFFADWKNTNEDGDDGASSSVQHEGKRRRVMGTVHGQVVGMGGESDTSFESDDSKGKLSSADDLHSRLNGSGSSTSSAAGTTGASVGATSTTDSLRPSKAWSTESGWDVQPISPENDDAGGGEAPPPPLSDNAEAEAVVTSRDTAYSGLQGPRDERIGNHPTVNTITCTCRGGRQGWQAGCVEDVCVWLVRVRMRRIRSMLIVLTEQLQYQVHFICTCCCGVGLVCAPCGALHHVIAAAVPDMFAPRTAGDSDV